MRGTIAVEPVSSNALGALGTTSRSTVPSTLWQVENSVASRVIVTTQNIILSSQLRIQSLPTPTGRLRDLWWQCLLPFLQTTAKWRSKFESIFFHCLGSEVSRTKFASIRYPTPERTRLALLWIIHDRPIRPRIRLEAIHVMKIRITRTTKYCATTLAPAPVISIPNSVRVGTSIAPESL